MDYFTWSYLHKILTIIIFFLINRVPKTYFAKVKSFNNHDFPIYNGPFIILYTDILENQMLSSI